MINRDKPTIIEPTPEPVVKPQRKMFSRGQKMTAVGIFALVCICIGLLAYAGIAYLGNGDTPSDSSSGQPVETGETNEEVRLEIVNLQPLDDGYFSEVQTSLAVANTVRDGVSLGYLRRELSTEELILRGERALNEQNNIPIEDRVIREGEDDNPDIVRDDYDSALFFRKNVNGIVQIFSLNTASDELIQLTDGDTEAARSTPLFSTVHQALAYSVTNRESNSGGITCDVHINELDALTIDTIDIGLRSRTCVTPVAWSPASKWLALTSKENDGHSQSSGLLIPYQYDYESGESAELNLPDGYDGLRSHADFRWVDEHIAIMTLVDRSPFGELVGAKDFFYDFKENRHVQVDVMPIEASNYTQMGSIAYTVFDDTSEERLKDGEITQFSVDGTRSALQNIENTRGTNYLLPLYTDKDEVSGLVYSRKYRQDIEDNQSPIIEEYNTVSLTAEGAPGSPESLFAPRGENITLLGWGETYDSLFYMATSDSGREVRVYSVGDQTDLLVRRDIGVVN